MYKRVQEPGVTLRLSEGGRADSGAKKIDNKAAGWRLFSLSQTHTPQIMDYWNKTKIALIVFPFSPKVSVKPEVKTLVLTILPVQLWPARGAILN